VTAAVGIFVGFVCAGTGLIMRSSVGSSMGSGVGFVVGSAIGSSIGSSVGSSMDSGVGPVIGSSSRLVMTGGVITSS
jgi:hypothetical protein